MTAQNPFRPAVGRIKVSGRHTFSISKKVEDSDEFYPGRLARKGATIDGVVVGNALVPPEGWIDYEESPLRDQPEIKSLAYAENAYANITWGGAFAISATLAKGFVVDEHAPLMNWADGQVAGPVAPAPGGFYLGIPFAKSTDEKSTNITLPADMIVGPGSFIEVTKALASGTIDVGLLSTEANGDADGFLDGVSCAAEGIVGPIISGAASGDTTLGALVASELKSSDTPAVYFSVPKNPGHVCDGTTKTVTYTTSDHDVAGIIWLHLIHPGLTVVGRAETAASAATAAATVVVSNGI